MAIESYKRVLRQSTYSESDSNWLLAATNLTITYHNVGEKEKAGLLAKEIIDKVGEENLLERETLPVQLIYAEYLLTDDGLASEKVAEAYLVYDRLKRIVFPNLNPREALEVYFGLSKCWKFKYPRDPQLEDLLPVAVNLTQAFEQLWMLSLSEEDRLLCIQMWGRKFGQILSNFYEIMPVYCFTICEEIRSRGMLIDVGYSILLDLDQDFSAMLTEEAQLSTRQRSLNHQFMLLRAQSDRFNDPTTARDLADLKRALVQGSRQLDLLRYRLSQVDEEKISIRRGQSIKYEELISLLKI